MLARRLSGERIQSLPSSLGVRSAFAHHQPAHPCSWSDDVGSQPARATPVLIMQATSGWCQRCGFAPLARPLGRLELSESEGLLIAALNVDHPSTGVSGVLVLVRMPEPGTCGPCARPRRAAGLVPCRGRRKESFVHGSQFWLSRASIKAAARVESNYHCQSSSNKQQTNNRKFVNESNTSTSTKPSTYTASQ